MLRCDSDIARCSRQSAIACGRKHHRRSEFRLQPRKQKTALVAEQTHGSEGALRAARVLCAHELLRLLHALDSKSRTEGRRFPKAARRRARTLVSKNTHPSCTHATDDAIASSSLATGHSKHRKGERPFCFPVSSAFLVASSHSFAAVASSELFPPLLCRQRANCDEVRHLLEAFDVGKQLAKCDQVNACCL